MLTASSAAVADVNWSKFDEYGDRELSTQEQRARLKELAVMLRGWKGSMISVIAYGGRISCFGEARIRGEAVKQYLAEQGIDRKQVRVIDAGHAENWIISIWVAPAGVEPISADSFTTDRKDVSISTKCKIDKLASRKQRRS